MLNGDIFGIIVVFLMIVILGLILLNLTFIPLWLRIGSFFSASIRFLKEIGVILCA